MFYNHQDERAVKSVINSMPKEIFFLSTLSPAATTKHKEHVQSEVRSHAARLAHTNRAGRARVEVSGIQRPVIAAPQVITWRTRPSKRESREDPSVYGSTHRQERSKRPRPMLTSADDPRNETRISNSANQDTTIVQRNANPLVAGSSIRAVQYLISDSEKTGVIFWNISSRCSARFCSMLKTKNILTSEWLHFMDDEAFFHVASALVKGEYKELQCAGSSMDREIFYHKIKALGVLRRRLTQLNGELDNVTLLAVLFLPFTDDLIADQRLCAIHWTAARKILATPGRLQTIRNSPHGAYTLDVINQVRGFCRVHTGMDMLPGDTTVMATGVPPLTPVMIALGDDLLLPDFLPSGFKSLANRGLIGEHTYVFSRNVIDFLQPSPSTVPLQHGLNGDVNQDILTSNFQEAWDFFNMVPSTIIGEPSIEDIVCLGLIIYSSRAIGPVRMASFVSRAARASLSIQIQQCILERCQEEENTLFWACTVAVEAWKTKFGELYGDGITIRDFQVRRFPRYLSRDVAREIVQRFYCDEQLLKFQEYYMRDFWKPSVKQRDEEARLMASWVQTRLT